MGRCRLLAISVGLIALTVFGVGCGNSEGDSQQSTDASSSDKSTDAGSDPGNDSDDASSDPGNDSGGTDPDTFTEFKGKKGFATTLRKEGQPGSWVDNVPKIEALDVYWNHSWSAERVEQQPDDVEFVPVIFGGKNATLEDVLWTVNNFVKPEVEKGNVRLLLGYNEPHLDSQADMTVEHAASLWPGLETAGIPLASPSGNTDWLTPFFDEVDEQNLRVDYVNLHWYGQCRAQNLVNAVWRVHDLYKLPVIITEFAPAWGPEDRQCHSAADVLAFAKEALPKLESIEYVIGYAWFSFSQNADHSGRYAALFEDGTVDTLTPLGRYYKSVTKENPSGDQSISAGQ